MITACTWEAMQRAPRRLLSKGETVEAVSGVAEDMPIPLIHEAALRRTAAAAFFHEVIEDWIRDPKTTIACGRWADGAVSEITPAGRARLLPARYHGCSAGVREIRLAEGPSHLHIDLGRIHKVCYAVAPDTLEVRLLALGPGDTPTGRWSLSLMPGCADRDGGWDEAAVRCFVERMRQHVERAPGLVELSIAPETRQSPQGADLLRWLREAMDRAGTKKPLGH